MQQYKVSDPTPDCLDRWRPAELIFFEFNDLPYCKCFL